MYGNRQSFFTALVIIMLSLTGCESLLDTGNNRSKKTYGLTESSYAAADMLAQQSKSFITHETPLKIGVLTDLNHPNEKTNFSRMVSEQVASRFVQLGYNIIDSHVLAVNQQNSTANSGYGAITGRYAVARSEVLINLRIVEIETGKVLAAYDYTLPNSRDIKELTKTQADKDSFFDF